MYGLVRLSLWESSFFEDSHFPYQPSPDVVERIRDFNDTIFIPTQIGSFASIWEYSGTSAIPVRTQNGCFAVVWE